MNPLDPQVWFTKADRDLGLAKLAQAQAPHYPDLICYHCQQAAEKYLKALVIHHALPLRKTHDLEELLDLLVPFEAQIDNRFYEEARKINDYGIDARYPDPFGDPSPSDVAEAIAAAEFFRLLAAGVLGMKP
jgi:HEPN domain-containing protein